jgi:hypothetical protein
MKFEIMNSRYTFIVHRSSFIIHHFNIVKLYKIKTR